MHFRGWNIVLKKGQLKGLEATKTEEQINHFSQFVLFICPNLLNFFHSSILAMLCEVMFRPPSSLKAPTTKLHFCNVHFYFL